MLWDCEFAISHTGFHLLTSVCRKDNTGKIYGNNLNTLVGGGGHAGFAALVPTDSWTSYNDTPPLHI